MRRRASPLLKLFAHPSPRPGAAGQRFLPPVILCRQWPRGSHYRVVYRMAHEPIDRAIPKTPGSDDKRGTFHWTVISLHYRVLPGPRASLTPGRQLARPRSAAATLAPLSIMMQMPANNDKRLLSTRHWKVILLIDVPSELPSAVTTS
jgi:hypothetical protein